MSTPSPDFSKEFLEEAFARGDECGANFHDGKLIGFGFQCRTRAPVTEQLDLLVPPGFRYGYKAWIHPDHRRRNLSRIQGYVRFNTLPRPFEERSISYIETHNYPSLLHSYVHPRLRHLRTGYVGWVTLFGRQIPFNSRGAKRIGFEFVKKSDTRIRQYVL